MKPYLATFCQHNHKSFSKTCVYQLPTHEQNNIPVCYLQLLVSLVVCKQPCKRLIHFCEQTYCITFWNSRDLQSKDPVFSSKAVFPLCCRPLGNTWWNHLASSLQQICIFLHQCAALHACSCSLQQGTLLCLTLSSGLEKQLNWWCIGENLDFPLAVQNVGYSPINPPALLRKYCSIAMS